MVKSGVCGLQIVLLCVSPWQGGGKGKVTEKIERKPFEILACVRQITRSADKANTQFLVLPEIALVTGDRVQTSLHKKSTLYYQSAQLLSVFRTLALRRSPSGLR